MELKELRLNNWLKIGDRLYQINENVYSQLLEPSNKGFLYMLKVFPFQMIGS
jgi:hypothetical protein